MWNGEYDDDDDEDNSSSHSFNIQDIAHSLPASAESVKNVKKNLPKRKNYMNHSKNHHGNQTARGKSVQVPTPRRTANTVHRNSTGVKNHAALQTGLATVVPQHKPVSNLNKTKSSEAHTGSHTSNVQPKNFSGVRNKSVVQTGIAVAVPQSKHGNQLTSNITRGNSSEVHISRNVANLQHKKSTGITNWNNFRIQRGLPAVVPQPKLVKKTNTYGAKLTPFVAMDCEMVGIGPDGDESMLARVSIVNSNGDCIYDKYVKARAPVTDYRTSVSGIRPSDMDNGENFFVVKKEVQEILKGRFVVGHSLRHDFEVLEFRVPHHRVKDTAIFFRNRDKSRKTYRLKDLVHQYLGAKIQTGEHDSVEDARAALRLYQMFRKEWEG